MNQTHESFVLEEFDIKGLVISIFKKWKFILPFMVIGGFLLAFFDYSDQRHSSFASIYIKDDVFASQMVSHEHYKSISELIGVPIEELPLVEIQKKKDDPDVFTIVASADDLKQKIDVENAWATYLVNQAKQIQIEQSLTAISLSTQALEVATQDLYKFLAENRLSALSFSQLEQLSGVNYLNGDITFSVAVDPLPVISTEKRFELTRLLATQKRAMQLDYEVFTREQARLYTLETTDDYSIVTLSKIPEISFQKVLTNFFLGSLVVLILGILVIFIVEWWKTPYPQDT